jgi:uncharacterized membrane protein YhfC
VTYDYYITTNPYSTRREIEDADTALVAELYCPKIEAIFIAGASALGLSVYDNSAGHGLTGTLDQVMHEGSEA